MFAPRHLACTEHVNTPDPSRRLRIGYLSADFRSHSVSYTFESLLDGRDSEHVEFYGYGSVARPDKVTERLMPKFDVYRDILKLDNRAAADLIERDRIDILVDHGPANATSPRVCTTSTPSTPTRSRCRPRGRPLRSSVRFALKGAPPTIASARPPTPPGRLTGRMPAATLAPRRRCRP